MSGENKAVGCCLCGAIKFVAELPALWCINCHCHFCRMANGAAFVTWFGVSSERFRLGGREHLKWWYGPNESKRGFCDNCGSNLIYRSVKWPDEVHVGLGSIVNPVSISPIAHIFFHQHVGWYPFADSLPRLGGERGTELLEDEAPHGGRETEPPPETKGPGVSTGNKAVGRCLCGAVKLVADLPALWCIHCHCYSCRRGHGTAFVTWFGVPTESFRMGGREQLKWWYGPNESKRGFCGDCGSNLIFMSARWPDEVHVALGSIVNGADIAPTAHIFWDQHVDWYPFEDSLPRLGGERGYEVLPSPATSET